MTQTPNTRQAHAQAREGTRHVSVSYPLAGCRLRCRIEDGDAPH